LTKFRHCYPVNHRPAKVRERELYYSRLDFRRIESWFREKARRGKLPIFEVDPGNESGYFKRRYADKVGKLLFFTAGSVDDLKEMVLEYLPEDLYYDRNIYRDQDRCAECDDRGEKCLNCEGLFGQELMFDIDPENIECPNCGTLEDRVKGRSMFQFCYICFNRAIDETVRLYDELLGKGFTDLSVVFSGRGFHIYVFDEAGLKMGFEERKRLGESLLRRGFPIDQWVTDGEARLARVPFSLNGLVSRACTPIKIEEIRKNNYWRDRPFVPDFLL